MPKGQLLRIPTCLGSMSLLLLAARLLAAMPTGRRRLSAAEVSAEITSRPGQSTGNTEHGLTGSHRRCYPSHETVHLNTARTTTHLAAFQGHQITGVSRL
jgi:hypothetical protein